MDLGLDIIRTRGRAETTLVVREVGEIGEAEIALLTHERGITAPPLKRIGERHHALARLLAQGTRPGEAAAITGMSLSRISILQADPTFRELLTFYREKVEEKYANMHESLAGLSLDAVNLLRERIEDTPEEVTNGQLLEAIKIGADRTGFGPKSTQEVNVNVGLATRMQEARERAAARRAAIDVEVLPSVEAAE